MTEFKGDKRTKEYKAWKAKYDADQKGLGTTVEKVFEKTGVAKVAKWALGEDCGCNSRRDALNKLFPGRKPECLTEEEYNYFKPLVGHRGSLSVEQQKKIIDIYNRVFHDKVTPTSCSSCFLNNIHKQLEKLFKEYE